MCAKPKNLNVYIFQYFAFALVKIPVGQVHKAHKLGGFSLDKFGYLVSFTLTVQLSYLR